MTARDERVDAIERWLAEVHDTPLTDLRPASEDASFRRYFRVDDAASATSFIVMDAPPDKEDTAPFIKVTQMLRDDDVHAPAIIASDSEQGFLLLEDLGTRTYLPHLQDDADGLYSDAIDALLKMQAIDVTDKDLPPYDDAFLRTEMQLFDDWYADRHLGKPLTASQLDALAGIKQCLVDNSLLQPQVFVHRDYHSRNLMVLEHDNPGVIDYQDAMHGAITYDLVSLFKDCYIEWPRERVVGWVQTYLQRSSLDCSLEEFLRWFDLMGLQRHLKVLGIFCRLYYRDGKSQYLDDLPLVKRYVINTCALYPELAPMQRLLEELDG